MAKQKKPNPEQNALDDIRVSTEKNAPQIEALVTEGKITAINGLKVLNGEMTLKDAKKEGAEKVEAAEPETVVEVAAVVKRGGRASAISDDLKFVAGEKEVRDTGALGKIKAAFKRPTKVGTAIPNIVESMAGSKDKWFSRDAEGFVRSYIKDAVKAGVLIPA